MAEEKVFDEDLNPRSLGKTGGEEGKSPFSQMSRVLSEEDLKSPITARVLLSQFDEYQVLKNKYEQLLNDYHEKDKKCAIYKEQRKGSTTIEILNSTMLAIGPLLLGTLSYLVPTYEWNAISIIDAVAGGGLLIAGVVVKFCERIIIMDLEILYIKDNGTLDKERVVLLVKEDCDLGHYILATSHMNAEGETFSSKIANTFWLPDQKVQKGDKVVIYTKEGVKNSRSNEDKTTSYFYYWGLNKPLNSDDDNTCVVVFRASWMVERVPYNAGN